MQRFKTLNLIADVYRALGWLFLVLAVVASLLVCVGAVTGAALVRNAVNSQMGATSPALTFLAAFVWIAGIVIVGILAALPFLLIGEFLKLTLAIEENTRATRDLLEK